MPADVPAELTFGAYAATWLKVRKVRGRPLAAKTRSGYLDRAQPHHFVEPRQGPRRRNALLFPDSAGAHLTPSAFYGTATVYHRRGPKKGEIKRTGHGWYRARQAANRDDLHFHDLRHTGLTNAAVAGATIAELIALAGHSTPGAAMRYQHAANDRMQDLAPRLSELAVSTSAKAS
jgi:integrase